MTRSGRAISCFILCTGVIGGATGRAAAQQTTTATEEPIAARPGLFRVGAWYLTPYLRIGSLGVDTNVFYTPTDRQTDFTASGGPGLEIVRPSGRESRFRLDLVGVKTRLFVEERYRSSYSRPGFEVNERVQQEAEGTQGFLRRNLGDRFALAILGSRERTTTDSQYYLGTDLGNTLTEDEYRAGGELRLALSVKTQIVGGGEQDWYRYPRLPERDGESTKAYGGFRTDDTALISGQALLGYQWFRLDTGGERSGLYASADAAWNLSPKTKLGLRYHREIDYSAFATSGTTPTNVNETVEVYLDRLLARNLYFRLFGRIATLASDGAITIVTPDGIEAAVRDDRVREAGAEFGYQFRTRVRIGVTATYTSRESPFETFGVEGLLAGLTVQYNPPQPTFR